MAAAPRADGGKPVVSRVPGPERAELSLQNPHRYRGLQLERLRCWLGTVLGEVASESDSLAVRFVDDEEMTDLNASFRGVSSTTDVLSFAGGESVEGRHLGDIAISIPAARRQAAAAGHTLERELRLLLLHGVLHCLGYDHESDSGEMDALEKRLRRRFLGP